MNVLKLLQILTALFCSIQISAQKEDTACVKSRWIALSPCVKNTALFTDNSNTSILSFINKAVFEKKVFLYESEDGYSTRQMSTPVIYNMNATNKLNRFEMEIESTTPLANMYGEDSVVTLADGSISFVFPPMKKYSLNFSEVSEIRIQEQRVLDTGTNSYTYQPVTIAFCLKSNGKEYELFRVDFDELIGALNAKESYDWVEVLTQKKYTGFQYKQVSCYDGKMRD